VHQPICGRNNASTEPSKIPAIDRLAYST
jgi:hypothetical protein